MTAFCVPVPRFTKARRSVAHAGAKKNVCIRVLLSATGFACRPTTQACRLIYTSEQPAGAGDEHQAPGTRNNVKLLKGRQPGGATLPHCSRECGSSNAAGVHTSRPQA